MGASVKRWGTVKTKLYFLFIGLIVGWIAVSYWCNQCDDAYIFYSYAKNISDGKGYVFNLGEKVNATTSPLYTLMLAGARLATLKKVELPVIGHAINALSLLALCIFLFMCLKRFGKARYIAPLLLLANPLLYNAPGMDVMLSLAIGMAFLYHFIYGKKNTAAALGALAVLARPDMIALVAIAYTFGWLKYRSFGVPSLKEVLIFLSVLAPWIVFSLCYFGDIVPASVAAKMDQQLSGCFCEKYAFLSALFNPVIYTSTAHRTWTLCAFASCIGCALFRYKQMSRSDFVMICLTWIVGYTVAYGLILKTPPFTWYYVIYSLLPAIVLPAVVDNALTDIGHIVSGVIVAVVSGVIVAVAICVSYPAAKTGLPQMQESWKNKMYRAFAEWMNAKAPGSSLATNDIGILRYYMESGRIIDMVGLVTPGVSEKIRAKDYYGVIDAHKPDYVLINGMRTKHIKPRGAEAVVYDSRFTSKYKVQATALIGDFRKFELWGKN